MGDKVLLNVILKRDESFLSNTPLAHELLYDLSSLLKHHQDKPLNRSKHKRFNDEKREVFTFPDDKVSALKARRTE